MVGRTYCVLSHLLNYSVKYHFELVLFARTISVLFEPSKSNSQHSSVATPHLSVTTECHSDNFIKIPATKSRCCRILYSVLFASIKSKKCGEEYQVYPLGTRRWIRATEDYFIYFMNKGELVSLSPTLSIFCILPLTAYSLYNKYNIVRGEHKSYRGSKCVGIQQYFVSRI